MVVLAHLDPGIVETSLAPVIPFNAIDRQVQAIARKDYPPVCPMTPKKVTFVWAVQWMAVNQERSLLADAVRSAELNPVESYVRMCFVQLIMKVLVILPLVEVMHEVRVTTIMLQAEKFLPFP
jgi:hypothetical protein|eukprot:COSAG06_NODE_161_length_21630_cov_19.444661_2_plen_123_part_00